MHRAALFGAAALLFSAVAAAPVKREEVIETVTHVDIVYEQVTKTVWVDPTDAPIVPYVAQAEPKTTTTPPAIQYVAPPAPVSSSSSSSTTTSSSSSQAPPPPPPAPTTTSSSTTAPAPPPPAPTTTSSTSVYVAPVPTTTSTPVYVAPTPEKPAYVPPPAPTTTSTTAPAPAATQASQPASSPASSSPSGSTHSGDITYYTVGLGSCGETNNDNEMVVAMSAAMMNKATMCGKSITLSYNGVQQKATVVDTCPGCSSGSLDLSPALFKAIAPNGDGRVHGVEWWFN